MKPPAHSLAFTLFTAALLAALAPGVALAVEATFAPTDDSAVPAATDSSQRLQLLRLDGLDDLIRDRLGEPGLEKTDVSVLFETVNGSVLYDRHPDRPLLPASNMKIVTGACALSTLGPNHRFVTAIGADGELADGALKGNLYVLGSGDPSIVSEELWKICDEIRARGIARIDGDIVLDSTWFDGLSTATQEPADGDRAYHARTGALSLNFNTVAVHVYPGSRVGGAAVVSVSPDAGFVEIRNNARTGSSRRGSTLEVRRSFDDGRNVVTVTGRIPEGAPGRTFYRNLEDSAGCFGLAMIDFLSRAGVDVGGVARAGAYPDGARTIYLHESKPLSLIVRDLGKYSNNFIAEQLLKAMSAESDGPPGTTVGGASVLASYLESVGADSGSFHVADGSGFSRDNRLTVRALVRVIRFALSRFETSYEFVASLSVSGVDGTLEDRMDFPGLRGSVRAKTGLLDEVTAISGVLRTVEGDEVLFSIITNGFDCEAWRLHDLEHEILTRAARTLPGLTDAARP